MNAMDAFHTFADWKAQNVENISAELLQRKAECDELRAQCEELKKELNMTASERAQREMRKKEVCVYVHSLPFQTQSEMNLHFCFNLRTVNRTPKYEAEV